MQPPCSVPISPSGRLANDSSRSACTCAQHSHQLLFLKPRTLSQHVLSTRTSLLFLKPRTLSHVFTSAPAPESCHHRRDSHPSGAKIRSTRRVDPRFEQNRPPRSRAHSDLSALSSGQFQHRSTAVTGLPSPSSIPASIRVHIGRINFCFAHRALLRVWRPAMSPVPSAKLHSENLHLHTRVRDVSGRALRLIVRFALDVRLTGRACEGTRAVSILSKMRLRVLRNR